MNKNLSLKSIASIASIFIVLLIQIHFESFCELKGGCAKVNITPPVGTWLQGFAARTKPSEDICDDLFARAIVLYDGTNTLAIIAADLIGIPLTLTNTIRSSINEKTGIPEKNILISASHTHYSALMSRGENTINLINENYIQTLAKKIVGAVCMAHKNMREVKIGTVKGDLPEVALNRRFEKPDGSVTMSWGTEDKTNIPPKVERKTDASYKKTIVIPFDDPTLTFKEIDPEVCIVRIEDLNGEIIGSIINFACHPTAAGSSPDVFYHISADYPAFTTEIVEKMEGGICLFTLGTAGDIVTIKRGADIRAKVGKALGAEALRNLQFVPTTNQAVLRALTKTVSFQLKPDRVKEDDNKYITTEIQALKINDIYFLGLPGEILVEIGLDIKRKSGIENLFIVSLSNDAIGYVCHIKAYEEGGYESMQASRLAKGSGEIMIQEALDILKKIQ